MPEKETWCLRTKRRYGISYAQLKLLQDLAREGRDVLILSPTTVHNECAGWSVKSNLLNYFLELECNMGLSDRAPRLIEIPETKASMFFVAHTEPVEFLRGRKFDRCLVTGVLDPDRAEMFTQEYFVSRRFDDE